MIVKIILLLLVIFLALIIYFQEDPLFSCDCHPITVGKSKIIGDRGIFATRFIKSGDVIEESPLIFYDRKEIGNDSILRKYDIGFEGGHALMLGYGSLYNHADDPNAYWNINGVPELLIKARKDIQKGEEIFVNYGPNYWVNRSDKIEV